MKIKGIDLVRKGFSPKSSKEGGPVTIRIHDVIPMLHNGCANLLHINRWKTFLLAIDNISHLVE